MTDDIEVTQEMVAAGAAIVSDESHEVSKGWQSADDVALWVYRAMEYARRASVEFTHAETIAQRLVEAERELGLTDIVVTARMADGKAYRLSCDETGCAPAPLGQDAITLREFE